MATEKNPFLYEEDKDNFIEEDDSVEVLPDGSVEVTISEVEETEEAVKHEHMENIASFLEKETLEEIGSEVIRMYKDDKESRGEWEQMFENGFDLLGLKLEESSDPFEGACTAVHPLLIESAVKFQSKASGELFPSGGPVRTQIIGEVTDEKDEQATRVREFMNFEITEIMPEYFDEFERLLFHLPLFGSAFKKVYYDAKKGRPVCEFVPVDQFYVPTNAVDLENADRYTHVIYRSPKDLMREIAVEMYLDLNLPEASAVQRTGIAEKIDTIMGFNSDSLNDPEYCLLEQHCYLELPGEFEGPFPLPYIVTVEEQSGQVLSIRRNYEEGDDLYRKINHFVHYKFVPGFGFYGLGFIHFLGNLTLTATTAMRALVDAGQFANLPGGFKVRGVRIVGGNDPIAPGEFKEVEATGMDLNKSIIPLPYKEPSQTLMAMLQFVVTAGQRFADSTEQVISDATNYGPVGTTLALLEASAKFFSAVHKRLHKAQRDEFNILARINYAYLPDNYPYDVVGGSMVIAREDFDGRIDVIPVSDPNIPSSAHRFDLAQLILQMASQAPPGIYDMREVHKRLLSAANISNIEQVMPPKKDEVPQNPMADIMSVSQGLPIKAFPGQNHDAHIQFKGAFLSDPAQQQNPQMQVIGPLLQANISEHMLLKYQESIGAIMQEQGPVDPSQQEFAMVQAAQQLQQMQQMAAVGAQQGSIQQQTLDIQRAKVQLEEKEIQHEAASSAAEMLLKNRELDLKERKIQVDAVEKAVTIQSKEEKDTKDRAMKVFIEVIKLMAKIGEDDASIPKDNIVVENIPAMFEKQKGRVVQGKEEGGLVKFAEGLGRDEVISQVSEWIGYDVGGLVERYEMGLAGVAGEAPPKPHGMLTPERVFGEELMRAQHIPPEVIPEPVVQAPPEPVQEQMVPPPAPPKPQQEFMDMLGGDSSGDFITEQLDKIVPTSYEVSEKYETPAGVDVEWIQQKGIEGTHESLGVPAKNKSKSGATIASGFDIGQHSQKEIEDYFGKDSVLTKKLLPFVGLKGEAAQDKIDAMTRGGRGTRESLVDFSKDELNLINETIYPVTINKTSERFNENSAIPFNQLPEELQTVIASVGFQYGNMKYQKGEKAGEDFRFYKHITEGDWLKALNELRNFGDKHGPRHNKEADLMEQGLKRIGIDVPPKKKPKKN